MSEQREMTLDEFLGSKLPACHLARRQLQELRDRLEAAERERDNRRGAYDVISEGYQRVTMENAALAAHVEYCHKIMRMVDEGPEFVSAKARRGIRIARMRKPETSLARLITEHVDAAIGHAESLIEAGATPEEAFAAVRRQAEGEGQ